MKLLNSLQFFIIAVLITVFPFAASATLALPQFPHLFYGTFTINNGPAAAGITIRALVGDTVVGSINTTEVGKYGGPNALDSKLVLQGDIENGDTIKFLIGDTEAAETAQFASGEANELNLSFSLSENQEVISNNTEETTINENEPELVITDSGAALSTINVPAAVTNPSINYSAIIESSADTNKVTITNDLSIEAETSIGNVTVTTPENLEISGPTSWNGIVHLPTVKENSTVTLPTETNIKKTVDSVIEIGFDDTVLTFNKAVKIVFTGKAGKYIGYSRGGVFTSITTICNADDQATVDAQLGAEGDCKIDSGSSDLVVWTKHFTKFVIYTQTDISPPSGGGGSPTAGDTIAPSISAINAVAGDTAATITWQTNESSISWIIYGETTDYGKEIKTTTYAVSHSITVTNLTPGVTYHFQIKSKDSTGNTASYTDKTFTTLSERIIGDTNDDGKVDKYDFALMMADWGREGLNILSDLNKDGTVNKYDFALLMANWTK